MSLSARVAAAWKSADARVRQGGAWGVANSVWVKENGVWVKEWQAFPNVGDAYQGGYYFGTMLFDGQHYAMVVAPKASEVSAPLSSAYSELPQFPGTLISGRDICSWVLANVSGGASIEAILSATGYNGGGFNDWYLPSTWELELLYRNLKPSTTANNTFTGSNPYSVPTGSTYSAGSPTQTAVAAFKTGGAQALIATPYLSATYDVGQGTTNTRNMNTGVEGSSPLDVGTWTRPIRRVPFTP